MGFWKNTLLLTGGVVAGYLASRAQNGFPGSDVEVRRATTLESATGSGRAMANFFQSSIGRPLQPYALKVMKFAATVKAGMDEKEAELHERFDTRHQPTNKTSDQEPPEQIVKTDNAQQLTYAESFDGVILESDEKTSTLSDTRHRIARDQALGDDFFA